MSKKSFLPGQQMRICRLVFFLCGLVILLFTGNYLDIWKRLRITRIRNPLLRLAVVLFIDGLLFIASILVFLFTGLVLGIYHAAWF